MASQRARYAGWKVEEDEVAEELVRCFGADLRVIELPQGVQERCGGVRYVLWLPKFGLLPTWSDGRRARHGGPLSCIAGCHRSRAATLKQSLLNMGCGDGEIDDGGDGESRIMQWLAERGVGTAA